MMPPADANSPMTPRLARRTPDHVLIATTILVCLPLLAVAQFAALARVDDIDAVFFAYCGKRLLAGQRLYADLWDNKTPGIYWIDAIGLWISNGKFWGVAMVVSLATLGSSLMFFLSARRLFGLATAAIGTMMAALYINLYDYHVGANRPDTFYVFFDLAELWFYLRAFDARASRRRNFFGAGVCAACSIGFRQTAVAAMTAIVIHQVFLAVARRQRWGELIAFIRDFALGGLSAVLAAIVVLWRTSDLRWAWHGAVASNLGYFTESRQSHVVPLRVFRWPDHVNVLGLPGILAAAAIVHAIGTRVRPGREVAPWYRLGGPAGVFVLLAAWAPIGWYLALIGPHRAAQHYYAVALPSLVMLATVGVWLLFRREDQSSVPHAETQRRIRRWGTRPPGAASVPHPETQRRIRRWGTRQPRYYVIVAVLWFVYMAIPAGTLQVEGAMMAHFQRFDERAGDRWGWTIEAIEKHTKPTDRLYSMRYLPFVFWAVDRPQAERYLLDTLIDQWNERSQPYIDEVVERLKADPPKCIIAGRADMADMDNRTSGLAGGRDGIVYTYHDLADWIRGNYRLVNEDRGADVWIHQGD